MPLLLFYLQHKHTHTHTNIVTHARILCERSANEPHYILYPFNISVIITSTTHMPGATTSTHTHTHDFTNHKQNTCFTISIYESNKTQSRTAPPPSPHHDEEVKNVRRRRGEHMLLTFSTNVTAEN